MSQRSSCFVAAVFAASLGALGFVVATTAVARQPATARAPANAAAAGLKVPPLPEGTPAELLAFVEGLREPTVRPRSREEMMAYMKDVAAVTVQAADKILAKVQPADPTAVQAAKLKLESLMMLGRLGDKQAAAGMAAYAKELAASPNAELAAEAQRMMVVADAQTLFATGDLQAGPAIIQRAAQLLAANPDDAETAGLAAQLANAFESLPGGEALAATSMQAFGPLFAKSGDPRIKAMGESFAGTLRRLQLVGKPMEIKGTLLDGKPFNQASVAGKVVLVDFWATWCGPCVAELPNMLAQYEKYRGQGFEIVGVSLDEDRDALVQFVTEKKLPWPVLFEKPEGEGWRHPLATFYGITGIPQLILIGRDGNVITLNARGEQLGEKLAELFKDKG